jgi:thiopurine S-methyltransferase
MDPELWHERWQRNQIGFHQKEINAHLQAFWGQLTLPAEAPVFVPLCGKSRDMLWLRAHGHPVLGVELSGLAVRDFFAENDLVPWVVNRGDFDAWECNGIILLCGDFFDLRPEDLTGCLGVYDRASLVALPPAMRERYARHLQALLPPAAEILLVTREYPDGEMQGPPFSVREPEVRSLYGGTFQVQRLYELDCLLEAPDRQARGLTSLVEKVYRLRRAGT